MRGVVGPRGPGKERVPPAVVHLGNPTTFEMRDPRVRALLASGELGSDAGQLADSLIDSITDKSGPADK